MTTNTALLYIRHVVQHPCIIKEERVTQYQGRIRRVRGWERRVEKCEAAAHVLQTNQYCIWFYGFCYCLLLKNNGFKVLRAYLCGGGGHSGLQMRICLEMASASYGNEARGSVATFSLCWKTPWRIYLNSLGRELFQCVHRQFGKENNAETVTKVVVIDDKPGVHALQGKMLISDTFTLITVNLMPF